MCVIISKQPGQTIPPDIIEDCFYANPDGFGAAYHDGLDLHGIKGLFTLDKIQELAASLTHCRAFLHFRIRTHGATNKKNCHPFRVSGGDGLLMHNGCLDLTGRKDWSDTRELAHLLHGWSVADIRRSRDSLSDWHGGGNRLAFLFADGSSLRTGDWHVFEGLQFSNLNWQHRWHWPVASTTTTKTTTKTTPCQWCEEPTAEVSLDGICESCQNRLYGYSTWR